MNIREAFAVDGGRTSTRRRCSEFEVRSALRRLQRRFDLRPSGRLDEDTRKLMSLGRCGNTDAKLQVQPETASHQTGSGRRRKRSAEDGDGQSEYVTSARQTESGVRRRTGGNIARQPEPETVFLLTGTREPRRRQADDRGETGGSIRVPIARRTAKMTSPLGPRLSAGIDHARLHSRLVPGTAHGLGAALRRRKKMYVAIRERHRLQIAREGEAARRNHTEEELAAIRRRIRNGRAQRVGGSGGLQGGVPPSGPARRRPRRSISVPSFDDRVNEGPGTKSASPGSSAWRMRFQKDGNSPVRWRLLADGVSGKIPLIDQRAILELAFRMWSEVIPLKFHESNSINVVDVDVVIAFAKRESPIAVIASAKEVIFSSALGF